ncbi:MAG: DUF1446 domain-containing protein [Candidatus Accumulibacter sp.]|nr:DUF1446 domain-containing protein [Accumulibacter sp.]
MKTVRIGSGIGCAGDRLEPALELIEKGNIQYVGFECLSGRTLAIAQQAKRKNPSKGCDRLLEYRMEQVIPLAVKHKVKVIADMGAANPEAAAEVCAAIARRQGIPSLKIAAVLGDDVFDRLDRYRDDKVRETGRPLRELEGEVVSANAYLGVKGIVKALGNDADLIITGCVADPAIYMAPLIHEFGWKMDDWNMLGKGALAGHLLERASRVVGTHYEEPGRISHPHRRGLPIAECAGNGDFFVTKVPGSGGVIDRHTCVGQMIHGLHDPASYSTPDVAADFSRVTFEETGPDRVTVQGGSGKPRPPFLKVAVSYRDRSAGDGGPGRHEWIRIAAETVKKRLELRKISVGEVGFDFAELDSIYQNRDRKTIEEIHLRKADPRIDDLADGVGQDVREIIYAASLLIDRNDVDVRVVYKEVGQ